MSLGYKRADLRANAERKFADALSLFSAGSSSNSYYLAGYAVELGLKACIASQVAADTVPNKEMLKGFLDHDFRKLVGLAGLGAPLKQQQASDIQFGAYWAIVSEWSPDSRYDARDRMSAQVLLDAIGDPNSGVLAWIRRYW